jgi:membrane-bound lytic murein transglycosylase D
MTRNAEAVRVALLSVFLLFVPGSYLFSQQSSLQTSPLASTAIRPVSANVTEAEHLPYLNEVAKEIKPGSDSFRPTASDLLIQKAEERFRNGLKFYQERDFTHARSEFDAAIEAMLQASDNPSDRRLFELRLEEMVDTIHRDDLSGLGAASVEEVPGFDKAPLEDIVSMTFPVDPRTKDKVQTEVGQITSALPLVVNDTVLGYINYFNGRGHRTIEAGLERAGKYRAMISRILAEEGVPQELIHLAQAESGFLPRAVSRASAEGMWQFVKFRGNQYGLKQTPYSDDRLDPEKSTRAAARHLHDLYNEFGDWYLAIAAYNCGPGVIEKAVERTGYADFWELRARRMLPIETTNYVPIILAMTIMAKNAPEYRLDQISSDAPIEYDTINTVSPTNLALIGDLTDTPLPQLIQLNPALLRSIAPANFEIRVPKGMAQQVTVALERIPAERRGSWRMHRVEPGESLATIARVYNASSSVIASANGLSGNETALGDRLLIPAAYHEAVPALRVPVRTRSAQPVRGARTLTASRKAPVRTSASTVHSASASAKRQPQSAAGTLAQLKDRDHSLNR